MSYFNIGDALFQLFSLIILILIILLIVRLLRSSSKRSNQLDSIEKKIDSINEKVTKN